MFVIQPLAGSDYNHEVGGEAPFVDSTVDILSSVASVVAESTVSSLLGIMHSTTFKWMSGKNVRPSSSCRKKRNVIGTRDGGEWVMKKVVKLWE